MNDSLFIANLAEKLRKIRREGIATQIEIEAATGICQETVSKVLHGKRRRRTEALDALDRYADMLISNRKTPDRVSEAVAEFLAFGSEADLVASIRMCASLVRGKPLTGS